MWAVRGEGGVSDYSEDGGRKGRSRRTSVEGGSRVIVWTAVWVDVAEDERSAVATILLSLRRVRGGGSWWY